MDMRLPSWLKDKKINGKTLTFNQLMRKFPPPPPFSMWGTPFGHFSQYKEFGGTLESVQIEEDGILADVNYN